MPLTQSTPEMNDPLFRNQGGARSSYGYRGRGRGRGRSYVGPNSHIDSLSSQNLCYKKVNNAHGGQLRPNHESVNTSDSNPASGTHSVKNDPLQPALQGVSKTPAAATAAKPADAPPHKNGQPLPKAPSSSANLDTPLSSTPAKGDEAKALILQFGSFSPVCTNDWQAPAHTSSAPLNLDDQTHDQAPRDALKQDLSKKAVALIEKPVTRETKTEPQVKKDVLAASTKIQAQNIGGLNPQIQSQGAPTSSLQMPPHMPLEMGNSSQIPQQVFVPGLLCPPLENHSLLAYTTYHSVGCYPDSYMTGPPVSPAPSSLPLTSTELNGTTQGSRFHHLGVNLPSTNQSARVPAYVSAATTIPAYVVNANRREVPSVPSHVDAISKVTDVTSISIGDAQNGQKQPSKKVDGQCNFKGFKDLDDSSKTATSTSSQSIMILSSSGLGEVAPSYSSAIKVFANSSPASESCESQANVAAKQNCSPPCENITRESSVRKDEGELEGLEVLLPDNALKGSDALKGADQGNKLKLAKKAAVIPRPISAITLEAATEHDSKIMDILRPSSLSGSISGSSKVAMEPNKTKNRGKKLKELLQKADALGATTDLYMAYKGPEDKESFVASEHAVEGNMDEVSANANGSENNTLKNKDEEGKVEIDDWEEAADISTPNLDFSGEAVHSEGGVTAKKYSRDFLLTFADHFTYIPEGFEITSDVSGALLCGNVSTLRSGREYLSPRRAVDRPGGVSQPDRHGSRTTDADKWRKKPGPFPPSQDSRRDIGYRSIVLGSQGGRDPTYGNIRNPTAQHAEWVLPGQRNHSDSWQRGSKFNKVLMPSTHSQAPVIHKAEIKYEVGKVTDEEQAKQRKLKGILNKLTPQNFKRLFEQIKEVNIDNVTTLTGVISQIFDKALTEPTFCEMYANFCQHLASELPDLTVDNEKITFRRLLLNKCQEEFEKGEREEQEACNVDVEGNTEQPEGGIEEKRVKTRRRMLGNIRLIGELYKKRMLTERIMHECIEKLLGQYQNPDEENIEALCKLMSTIGEMIDHPKAKEHMDAYFDIMRQLSNNMVLSSRVRFMLKDAVDLRKNKWQQRMKVEGPKMIEDVHRDAAQERQGLVSRSNHGPSFNSMTRGQPLEFGPQGSMLSPSIGQGMSFRGNPSQVRGFGGQHMLTDARSISMPLPQRLSADKQITLGPQGGLARGMTSRGQLSVSNPPILDNPPSFGNHRRLAGGFNGYGTALERGVYTPREDHFNRNSTNRVGASAYDQLRGQELHPSHANRDLRFLNQNLKSSRPTTPPLPSTGVSFTQNSFTERPEERLRDMSRAAIKEFYGAKDEKEIALCIKDMNSPSFCSTIVSLWVSDSFERKDFERESLAELLVALTKPCDGTFSRNQLIKGFESVLTDLEDTVTDAPKAPEFLGQIFAKVVLENVLSLEDVGLLIQHGGEEAGRLVEVGLAAEVLGSLLETIKSEKGESSFREIRGCCNLQLEDFRPPRPISCRKLEMFI